ncbi:MAG TPA: hypothetical protein VMD52_03325 [Patescibacteria group bacterium]|nr:hypothetical protein [Patescibacteria group bacterium]
MKKAAIIAFVVIACLITVGFAKDLLLGPMVSAVATQVTGAKVQIRGFSLGLIRQSVRLTGFKMYNPKGFSSGVLIDLPKIAIDYDLPALCTGKLHFRLVDIELKEIGLEKNKEGKLNVDSLKVAKAPAKGAQAQKPAKQMAIQLDVLNLNIGRIVSRDYTTGAEPTVQVYDINLNKSYKNITSVEQMAVLVLSEPMKHAGIKGAAIYGVAALTGVGFIPAVVAATLSDKDSVKQDMNVAVDRLYDTSLSVLKRIGKVSKEDKASGAISAEVSGVGVTVKCKSLSAGKAQIAVSARKYMLPKPEIASGVLYQISEQLK